jgi:hypothetical protein
MSSSTANIFMGLFLFLRDAWRGAVLSLLPHCGEDASGLCPSRTPLGA